MVKEVADTDKKEELKHRQEIITKADAKINFRNREIKILKNEHFKLYEELKGMEEVLHHQEKEFSIQWATMENARENHHKDYKLLVAKEKTLWKELGMTQGKLELLILQTTNDWENMAIENKTKAMLYDEFVQQFPVKMDELLEEAKVEFRRCHFEQIGKYTNALDAAFERIP
jgi:hypothetical protein